jgi:hypothetical protein
MFRSIPIDVLHSNHVHQSCVREFGGELSEIICEIVIKRRKIGIIHDDRPRMLNHLNCCSKSVEDALASIGRGDSVPGYANPCSSKTGKFKSFSVARWVSSGWACV